MLLAIEVPSWRLSERTLLVLVPNTVWRKHIKTQEAKLSLNVPRLLC